ncbi:MAG: hypothetical protein FWE59_02160 [Oscillospiraceae bacterium]|nr:hypothetical protein [Oscillospiraceae bacterium]
MVDMLERMGMIKKDEDAQPTPNQALTNVETPTMAAPPAVPTASAANVAAANVAATTTGASAAAAVAAAPGLAVPSPAAPSSVIPESAAPVSTAASEGDKSAYTYTGPSAISSLGDNFWDDTPSEPEPVERYLEIDELYYLFQMQTGGIDTVYLLEEYIKTLPDSLPADLRRSIIVRIVQASGFDFDKLLSDGIDRVSKLNEYAGEFAARTDVIVTQQNETIADLERQIELVRAVITERKNLHKKQFLSIENEAQRLKKILDFITK